MKMKLKYGAAVSAKVTREQKDSLFCAASNLGKCPSQVLRELLENMRIETYGPFGEARYTSKVM